jgi:hypothetical protein
MTGVVVCRIGGLSWAAGLGDVEAMADLADRIEADDTAQRAARGRAAMDTVAPAGVRTAADARAVAAAVHAVRAHPLTVHVHLLGDELRRRH